MSKPTACLLALALAASACSERSPEKKLCLDSDLGAYRLEEITMVPNGCVARYREFEGRGAQVTVQRGPFDQPDGAVLFEFEKHKVYYLHGKHTVEVLWHSGPVRVDLQLQGTDVPAGPVLRGYLFEYRSDVAGDVAEVERQVEDLKAEQRRRPKDAAIHLELARKYRSLGNKVMATQEFHVAIDADRGCYDCFKELGTLYLDLKHYDLAIRALRRAQALDEKRAEPHLLLGDVYWEVHNGQEALREYGLCLWLSPDGQGRARAQERLDRLRAGEYLIEVLPNAKQPQP